MEESEKTPQASNSRKPGILSLAHSRKDKENFASHTVNEMESATSERWMTSSIPLIPDVVMRYFARLYLFLSPQKIRQDFSIFIIIGSMTVVLNCFCGLIGFLL
jgi:hypothetical protein